MVSSPLNLISVYDVEDTTKYQGSLHQVFELLKYVDDWMMGMLCWIFFKITEILIPSWMRRRQDYYPC